LFLVAFFLFLPTPSLAQTTPTQSNTTATPPNTTSDVPNNLHNWTQSVMIEVMLSLTCQLVGIDPTTPNKQCLGVDQKTGKIGFLPSGNLEKGQIGGAIGGMNNMISMLYTPPLHTSDYFQNLAQNFGITKHAFAQATGTGFDSLKPLLNLWIAFRNMVYLIFVIVFIVIGLAVMLRIKIDPRTVMSIQNQIPKIIIGILLVTFSFAIAGFLIDLMWVFIYLIYGIFSGISGTDVNNFNPVNIQGQTALAVAQNVKAFGIFGIANNVAINSLTLMRNLLGIGTIPLSGVTDIFGAILGLHVPGTGALIPDFLIDSLSVGVGLFAGANTAQILNNNIVAFLTGGANITSAGIAFGTFSLVESSLRFIIPYGVVFLVVIIALFTALLRLWFALIMSYIYILIDVVLAPFFIIGGIIPGSPISLSGWLRDLIANLAAFPATIAMFMLGKVFMDSFGKPPLPGTQNFIPPLVGDPGSPSIIGSLIGLGIILMTPNIVNMLKTMLKAPKIDTGLGKALAPGLGTPGRLVGGSLSTALTPHYNEQGKLVYPGGPVGKFLRGFGFVRG